VSIDRYLRALDASLASEREAALPAEVLGYAAEPEVEVSRGDARMDDSPRPLVSEIDGVDDEQWTAFVRVMITSPLEAVSEANALGMFEMMPRRLGDFKLVDGLQRTKSRPNPETGRQRTIWVGKFVAPMTSRAFLRSPRAQYQVFCQSMRDYVARLERGEIESCEGLSLSGTLAVLHRCGPRGAETWASGERFSVTEELVERADGLF
jgi:hypothetical protein